MLSTAFRMTSRSVLPLRPLPRGRPGVGRVGARGGSAHRDCRVVQDREARGEEPAGGEPFIAAAVARRPACARSVPSTWPSPARSENVRGEVPLLQVGREDGRRDDHRPVEADQREVESRNTLLRAEVVLALPGGRNEEGAGAEGDELAGGGLGGRGGDEASSGRRLTAKISRGDESLRPYRAPCRTKPRPRLRPRVAARPGAHR